MPSEAPELWGPLVTQYDQLILLTCMVHASCLLPYHWLSILTQVVPPILEHLSLILSSQKVIHPSLLIFNHQ